jgi:hypothetical protein
VRACTFVGTGYDILLEIDAVSSRKHACAQWCYLVWSVEEFVSLLNPPRLINLDHTCHGYAMLLSGHYLTCQLGGYCLEIVGFCSDYLRTAVKVSKLRLSSYSKMERPSTPDQSRGPFSCAARKQSRCAGPCEKPN